MYPSFMETLLQGFNTINIFKEQEKINGVQRKAYKFLLVKVQSGQRLATSPAPNLTFREVTN